MNSKFQPLHFTRLDSESTYRRPRQVLPERVTADNPAVDVLTDFAKVAAISMGPCVGLDQALARMIASGVRLLLITDQSNRVLGVLTTTDLQGERPMQFIQETGTKHEDIFLRDIMTPADRLEVLQMKDVLLSRVGDIIATLKVAGRQHALVVDDEDGVMKVRGIFSTKQISRQLGIGYEAKETAQVLADLEAALG